MKNTGSKIEKISYWTGVVVIGVIIGFSIQFVRAWVEPTSNPPLSNVGAPINTGSIDQIKLSGLGLRSLLLGGQSSNDWGSARFKAGSYGYWDVQSMYNYTNPDLIFSNSNGGEKFRVNANGQLCLGYKESNCTGGNGLLVNGNVGIGTANPVAKLDVAGSIKIADGNQGKGKVLTSDENGVAKWENATGGVAGVASGSIVGMCHIVYKYSGGSYWYDCDYSGPGVSCPNNNTCDCGAGNKDFSSKNSIGGDFGTLVFCVKK